MTNSFGDIGSGVTLAVLTVVFVYSGFRAVNIACSSHPDDDLTNLVYAIGVMLMAAIGISGLVGGGA